MTTTYSKIKGRSKGHRYRNSIVDLQRELYQRNAKMTPKELGMDERFEDDPRAIREKDYGRVIVFQHPPSNICEVVANLKSRS